MKNCSDSSIWCVIPVYNNGATVLQVALESLEYVRNVLVVDDGSTDVDVAALFKDHPVKVLQLEQNCGKGKALLAGLDYLKQRKARWMITIDADGQHKPEDILRLLPELMDKTAQNIVIGVRDFSVPNVPAGSKFGRKFSNFWIRVECGVNLADTQSGFRAYPVDLISQMKFRGCRYDFEVEVLTRAVWGGLGIREVPIQVIYPPPEERVSHFNKGWDNFLLTHRHAMLISRRMFPWPHKQFVKRDKFSVLSMIRHPGAFFGTLIRENSSPVELGVTAAVSILLATLPLIGCHTVVILYVSSKFKLNRLLAVNMQHFCAPPVVPLLCIQVGFFVFHGNWFGMDELSLIAQELHHYIICWLVGSIILAPCLALLAGLLVYYCSVLYRYGWRKPHA